MEHLPRVLILMASHNAQVTIAKQLDTIFGQAGCEVSLWVADDSSSDNTYHILETYAAEHQTMRILFNTERRGVERRMFDLFHACKPDEFDYIGFAYQDEEWRLGKLEAAITRISANTSRPELYYGNVKKIDLNGIPLGDDYDGYEECVEKQASLLLVPNWAHASTMLMNRALVKLIQTHPVRDYGRDFWTWIHAAALYCGGYVYGDLSHVYLTRRTLEMERYDNAPVPETPEQRTKFAATLLREYKPQMPDEVVGMVEEVALRQTSAKCRASLAHRADIAVPAGQSLSKLRLELLAGRI